MRIDLEGGGRRPWYLKLVMFVAKRALGFLPPPILAVTYRPALMRPELRRYVLRGVSSRGASWSKGEAELFAAFVSNLNTCHF
ncbi:MAG: hypothetical protein H6713_01510 [Myxococcales bacterium]|nr:hypothetical protein [Myxococcales bacterium]